MATSRTRTSRPRLRCSAPCYITVALSAHCCSTHPQRECAPGRTTSNSLYSLLLTLSYLLSLFIESYWVGERAVMVECHRSIGVPVFAVHRSRSGRWLVWAPDNNPFAPAVRSIAALAEPDYSAFEEPRSSSAVIRSFRSWQSRVPKTRAEINDISWPRQELLEIADLLSRLDVRDVEHFCLQRACLARELRRLAARRVAHPWMTAAARQRRTRQR